MLRLAIATPDEIDLRCIVSDEFSLRNGGVEYLVEVVGVGGECPVVFHGSLFPQPFVPRKEGETCVFTYLRVEVLLADGALEEVHSLFEGVVR